MLHFEKSIGCLQFLQVCDRSNSSEKISFSVPQLGHLQVNELRFLFASNPGQCIGVLIFSTSLYDICVSQSSVLIFII